LVVQLGEDDWVSFDQVRGEDFSSLNKGCPGITFAET
jgi:hypothetical protein